MNSYKALNKQVFSNGIYSIVPIRMEDRIAIMNWRNKQLYHLRQQKPLKAEDQDTYFINVVSKLFDQEQPSQILFSFLENGICIGYGGLVHINWADQNAEISFIMDTALEAEKFQELWSVYLGLIEQVAFDALKWHKIYTYAFDLRPHLYVTLEQEGYNKEAVLKEHCLFDGKYKDVVYHCKINRNINFRKANENDMMLYFDWTKDVSVRENSYQSEPISLEKHTNWFLNKIKDSNCCMMVFENHLNIPIGQVRIQITNKENAIIGISTDVNQRGKGYAGRMIKMASENFLKSHPKIRIQAYIKLGNEVSSKAFENAGYQSDTVLIYENEASHLYIKEL